MPRSADASDGDPARSVASFAPVRRPRQQSLDRRLGQDVDARAIVDLLCDGVRVGVAATSHKAIHNLLEAEQGAHDRSVPFAGLTKDSKDHPESLYDDGSYVVTSTDNDDFPSPPGQVQLIAGASCLFSREVMRGAVGVLVIDEAGQVGLADAFAMASAARSVVLLGDRQLRAHVSEGAHSRGSGPSVLQHRQPTNGGAVARRVGEAPSQLSSYRTRLIEKGTLVAEGDTLSCTAPGLAAYVLGAAEASEAHRLAEEGRHPSRARHTADREVGRIAATKVAMDARNAGKAEAVGPQADDLRALIWAETRMRRETDLMGHG